MKKFYGPTILRRIRTLLIIFLVLHLVSSRYWGVYKSSRPKLFCKKGVQSFFYIRTSKFCLRLAVLNFFFIFEAEMFLICSYFPDWTLQCHKEECQCEYYKNTIWFISFFFFQTVHIGSHWEMFYKKAVLQLC